MSGDQLRTGREQVLVVLATGLFTAALCFLPPTVFESADYLPVGEPDGSYAYWWQWYGWPWWWHHVNTVGRITWKLELTPGKPVEVNYEWHYFWR